MGKNGTSTEPLEVLIAAGTVRGTCLLNNGEVIYETFPYSAARLVKVCRVVEGLTKEFKNQGRNVDQMAFGYEGGNLLAVSVGNHRIIIMHLMNDEIDFLAQVARACLEDIVAAEKPAQEAESERISQKLKKDFSLETVPVVLARDREIDGSKRVEETAKVAVLSAPPIHVAPPVPGTEPESELSPENISLGI
ncbi:MAG: hypothetical protein GXP30_06645 [Verrucomicrobia bacterium]|nr:hypothetical protein [Verrucomicrobiota bacterium]